MKRCSHCGAAIENDSANFCPVCGQAAGPAPAPSVGAGVPLQGYAVRPLNPPPASRPLREAGFAALREAFQSPLFLALTITATLLPVLSIGSALTDDSISVLLAQIAPQMSAQPFQTGYMVGVLLSQLLPVLMCVGLWLCRVAAMRAETPDRFSTVGFTLLRVYTVAGFVVSCLVVLLGLVGAGWLLTGTNSSLIAQALGLPNDPMLAAVFSGMAVALVLCFGIGLALGAVYMVKSMKTLRALQETARTGYPTTFVSTFVAVYNLVMAGYASFSVLSVLTTAGNAPAGSRLTVAVSVLGVIAAMVYYLLLGLCLLRYKKKAEAVLYDPYFYTLPPEE